MKNVIDEPDAPDIPDIPLGLGMALAQNHNALTCFAALPETRKRQIIEQTHSIGSKREMRDFVNGLKFG